jgi:TadE-like protein
VSARGQALVEFALIFPVLIFAFLGMGEAGFLFAAQHGYQSEADVVAQWAAINGPGNASWDRIWSDEAARTGCDGRPVVTYPDGNASPGSRILVKLDCHYSPRITSNVWPGGLTVSVQSEAVVPGATSPPASPSPSP